MGNYFIHPLFEYVDFSWLDDAMQFFGFDYVKIAADEMEDDEYEELSEGSFAPAHADAWVSLLTDRDTTGWQWAGYWADENGDEYFMLVRPEHERAAKIYSDMVEFYPYHFPHRVQTAAAKEHHGRNQEAGA